MESLYLNGLLFKMLNNTMGIFNAKTNKLIRPTSEIEEMLAIELILLKADLAKNYIDSDSEP